MMAPSSMVLSIHGHCSRVVWATAQLHDPPKDKLGDHVHYGEALAGWRRSWTVSMMAPSEHDAGRCDGAPPASNPITYCAQEAHAQDDACRCHDMLSAQWLS